METEENKKLIEECFRQARISGELCDASILKYQDSIKKFFAIVNDKSVEDLELRDFDDFILAMRDNGASNSRIANVISAVKWLISRLQVDETFVNKLDLEKVKKPKLDRKEIVYLTENEISVLLKCISDDIEKGEAIRKVRMMALVVLLLESGARIGEVLSIKLADIDWENFEVPIIGKGNKPRTLFFRDRSREWLQRYLNLRNSENYLLFVTLKGTSKWSQTDVGRSFRGYIAKTNIKKHIKLHTLRHTTATQLSFKGAQYNEIQRLLGHTRLETTIKYYIGAVENQKVKQIMQDKLYDFIP